MMLGYWCFCYIIETNGFYYFVIFIMYGRLLGFFFFDKSTVSQSDCLSVCRSACLFVCRSVCLSVRERQSDMLGSHIEQSASQRVSQLNRQSVPRILSSVRPSVSQPFSQSVRFSFGRFVGRWVSKPRTCM